MRILIAGSTGLIGTPLVEKLLSRGDQVVRLVRPDSKTPADHTTAIPWEPERGKVALDKLEGFDAFINLAGVNIAGGRFTEAHKRAVHNSRVAATSILAHSMMRMKQRPGVLISASAIGFYGHRGDDILNENEWPGRGFLSDVCSAWEQSAKAAREVGIRVVHPRIGIVLALNGGALKEMLPAFRFGLGATLGDGKQYMSWISLDDVVSGIIFALDRDTLDGPVNFTAPNPVTNAEFTRALAKTLHRPALFTAPAPVLRLMLGEMADALLLASIRAVPEKLQQAGFQFADTTLEMTFSKILKTS